MVTMNEQEIREATTEQLREMVAEVLGYLYYWCDYDLTCYLLPSDHEAIPALTRLESRVDDANIDDVPDWPNSIAGAWELDGEGWLWEFYESGDALDVTIIGPDCWELCRVTEPWRGSKAATYATARCRAWLLARLAEGVLL